MTIVYIWLFCGRLTFLLQEGQQVYPLPGSSSIGRATRRRGSNKSKPDSCPSRERIRPIRDQMLILDRLLKGKPWLEHLRYNFHLCWQKVAKSAKNTKLTTARRPRFKEDEGTNIVKGICTRRTVVTLHLQIL